MANDGDQETSGDVAATSGATLSGHLRIMRFDHWFKNVFVLPGIVVAIASDPSAANLDLVGRIFIGLLATGLIASSNYVLNEILDAPFDSLHVAKRFRPVPSGQVNIRLGYLQWLVTMVVGVALGWTISFPLAIMLVVLWIMGCVYNIPPIRSKDVPYVDVMSEAVNNPIRMLIGWLIVGTGLIPPVSLLLSYWFIGCYFMALKRLAEYRFLRDRPGWLYLGHDILLAAANYRKSFGTYTERVLLVCVEFYGSAAMLFFGAFLMRYRLELVIAFPFLAWVMAAYFHLGFQENSPVQHPEQLYRSRRLMVPIVVCTTLMVLLLFIDLPLLYVVFSPTLPVADD
jgi:4-hydroxybenzoate polyprenyltransferase